MPAIQKYFWYVTANIKGRMFSVRPSDAKIVTIPRQTEWQTDGALPRALKAVQRMEDFLAGIAADILAYIGG